jgi:hypothetical protein
MFTQTWKKYLPVIILLMKRSDKGEQVLGINYTDFERAAGGKKARLSFSNLVLKNGRTNFDIKCTPLATDLIFVLQENKQSELLMQNKQFEFSLNSDFQLMIRSIIPVKETDPISTD